MWSYIIWFQYSCGIASSNFQIFCLKVILLRIFFGVWDTRPIFEPPWRAGWRPLMGFRSRVNLPRLQPHHIPRTDEHFSNYSSSTSTPSFSWHRQRWFLDALASLDFELWVSHSCFSASASTGLSELFLGPRGPLVLPLIGPVRPVRPR